jgi:hypothetical protein
VGQVALVAQVEGSAILSVDDEVANPPAGGECAEPKNVFFFIGFLLELIADFRKNYVAYRRATQLL